MNRTVPPVALAIIGCVAAYTLAAAAVEVDTPLVAEADSSERVIHFKLGKTREARTVRVGRDLLLDVDRQSQIAGVWLLNVPPFPDGMARLDEL